MTREEREWQLRTKCWTEEGKSELRDLLNHHLGLPNGTYPLGCPPLVEAIMGYEFPDTEKRSHSPQGKPGEPPDRPAEVYEPKGIPDHEFIQPQSTPPKEDNS